jgi:L-amino acid N-acyltransferase YncA
MTDIIIREGLVSDVSGISKVHVDCWRTTYQEILPEQTLKSLDYKVQEDKWNNRIFNNGKSDEFIYIAEHHGEIVGFASGSAGEGPNRGILFTIYILEVCQHQNIGSKLFVSIIKRLISAGIKEMIVWVFDENPSKAFYEKMGGRLYKQQQVNIGGKNLLEVSYLWNDINIIGGL